MNQIWKNLRVNFMYWRFRHITRNRLRLQSWWYRRRQSPVTTYRPRGTAAVVYRRSSRRVWIALLVMVAVLTAITVAGRHAGLPETLIYILNLLVLVGAVYWAVHRL